jgi:hypothetical protein
MSVNVEEIISFHERPATSTPARRKAESSPFSAGLPSTRRRFIRRALLAGTGVGLASLSVFPPVRQAKAEGYDLWYDWSTGPCLSYAQDHECNPACGPSSVQSNACSPGSWSHRNGEYYAGVYWQLRPNECYGGFYDGWDWIGPCGTRYRCHDGWGSTTGGSFKTICRTVV